MAKRYKAVIFDLDGTLLNTLDDLAAAGNHTLQAMGFAPRPVDDYRTLVGNGIPVLVQRMLPPGHKGDASQALALQLFRRYYSAHKADATAPYPGIPALLRRLQAAGVPMGVVSNKDDALAKDVVARYFPGLFRPQDVCGRREGIPPKPDPALVEAMCRNWGLAAADVLYAGDSNVDVQTARAAGMDCCGVLWGFRTREELAGEGAAHLAACAGDLAALLPAPAAG